MAWTVTLEAILLDANHNIDDAGDELLSALLLDADLVGVVIFTNSAQRTVGASFDVEALNVEYAVARGMASWSRATQQIGLDADQLVHVEIDRQSAPFRRSAEAAQAIA